MQTFGSVLTDALLTTLIAAVLFIVSQARTKLDRGLDERLRKIDERLAHIEGFLEEETKRLPAYAFSKRLRGRFEQ